MKYNITEEDKLLVQQPDFNLRYRLFIVDDNKNVLDEIQGIKSIGSYSIDAERETRRTTNFTLLLDNYYKDTMSIEKKLFSWIGYSFQMQIGIKSLRTDIYKWYDCGYYLITEANTSYNATDNSLTLNLADWYANLDGTRNGQIGGAPIIKITNVDENGKPVTIKIVTEMILKNETKYKDYIIDDIGEFYGMPQNNVNYEEYRRNNPLWNQLPYDLKYEVGCLVSTIFDEVKNLYPNCQMYFDTYGNFCFDLIPSCEHDPVVLDDKFIQSILLADNTEEVQYDIGAIKNVTEVFGQTYEIDRYSTNVTTSSNTYVCQLDDYEEYRYGDMIAFIPDSNNVENMKLLVNSLESIPIYYEYTTDAIEPNILEKGATYVLQIKANGTNYVAYYLGQYQPHALCILTADENDNYYTKDFFSKRYNCNKNNIVFRVEPESPFTVQKLGIIFEEKTGKQFDNILSDSVAKENAIYYNKQSSSIYDTVTITTKLLAFLDVNEKIEYKKQQEEVSHHYITKSIEHSLESETSQITMYRFYPLYYK